MKSGKPLDPSHNYDKGRTDDVVAQKSGFGSRDTYGKAKFIAENADTSPFLHRYDGAECRSGQNYRTMVQF